MIEESIVEEIKRDEPALNILEILAGSARCYHENIELPYAGLPETYIIDRIPGIPGDIVKEKIRHLCDYPCRRDFEGDEPTPLLIKQDMYLFSLKPDYRDYLKEGPVVDELRKAFEMQKHSLSSNAQISKRNGQWIVTEDHRETYWVKDTGTQLNIYTTFIMIRSITDIENILGTLLSYFK